MVEWYTVLREVKDTSARGLRWLLLLSDLDRAISHMPPKEYHAVLLHGLLGHVVRDAEVLLGCSKDTLARRYQAGIDWITTYLNYGDA